VITIFIPRAEFSEFYAFLTGPGRQKAKEMDALYIYSGMNGLALADYRRLGRYMDRLL
jgi:hypothetical protein